MRRNSIYEALAVLARNNSPSFSALWRDKILSFKTFKPPPLFFPRVAAEDEGGGLNGALAIERLERFERPRD